MGFVVIVTTRPGFTRGKGPPVPIGQETGWASEPVWTQRIEENPLLPRGMEAISPGRPVRSQTLY
jgi:hypothetical protein